LPRFRVIERKYVRSTAKATAIIYTGSLYSYYNNIQTTDGGGDGGESRDSLTVHYHISGSDLGGANCAVRHRIEIDSCGCGGSYRSRALRSYASRSRTSPRRPPGDLVSDWAPRVFYLTTLSRERVSRPWDVNGINRLVGTFSYLHDIIIRPSTKRTRNTSKQQTTLFRETSSGYMKSRLRTGCTTVAG